MPFVIQTDASDIGLAGVLVQGSDDEERVIAYMSQKFTSTQRKYSTTERECLGVLAAIEHFRPYIEGARFTVITDHASLIWLQNLKNPNGRLGRWILRLQQYDFKLVHRKGKHNVVPDALSRAMVDEIQILSENFNGDPWYDDLRGKLKENPEKYPDFRLEGDVIHKHCSNKCDVCEPYSRWKIVLPVHLRTRIMSENHDAPTSSHFGHYKTLKRIQESYYWRKMIFDIRQFVADCDQCKANKDPTYVTRSVMGEAKILDTPWHTVAIDFLGPPPPMSKKGNTYLFVALDCFSKFTILAPLKKADTNAAIKVLEMDVYYKFGIPSVLISDNGSQFISKAFKKFLDGYGIKHWLNAAYHPQHNPAERRNKVIAAAIRNYIGSDHRNWDIEIPQIACAINTATHQSTKFSPYYLNFGRNMPKTSSAHSVDQTLRNPDLPSTTDVIDRLNDIRTQVVSNLERAYKDYSHYYNLRSRNVSFVTGDVAWVRNFKLSDATKQ